MAEVKWIKITTNIFDDEKIKLIDTMPDRDTLLVIWFKLLAMAGKTNDNGLLYIIKEMPTTDEMLATIFNRPLNTVRLALKTFVSFGMIEVNDHVNIVNWDKHQNIDGLDKIREQNRKRQAKLREKKKVEVIEDKSNVTSRDSNAIEIEEDKELEKDNNKDVVISSEQIEYAKKITAHKEKMSFKIREKNYKLTPEDMLKWAGGDYELVERQFEHFGDKGVPYLRKAIQDKYEVPKPKKEEKKANWRSL